MIRCESMCTRVHEIVSKQSVNRLTYGLTTVRSGTMRAQPESPHRERSMGEKRREEKQKVKARRSEYNVDNAHRGMEDGISSFVHIGAYVQIRLYRNFHAQFAVHQSSRLSEH